MIESHRQGALTILISFREMPKNVNPWFKTGYTPRLVTKKFNSQFEPVG